MKPAYNGTARDQTFSFADKFCSVRVLEFRILGASKLPLKTILLYALVPLKAGSILFVVEGRFHSVCVVCKSVIVVQ